MATFTFKNVSNERKLARGTYDAPVNPILGFDDEYAPVANAAEDFAITAGDVKIPVYDHGVHGFAVVHAGETLEITTEKAAEIAFYTELVCQFQNKEKPEFASDCVEAKFVDGEEHTPESI